MQRVLCSSLIRGSLIEVIEITDKIRRICARLVDTPPDSALAARYRAELKAATGLLAAQQNNWDKASEGDEHQDAARQSYGSRERDSANGFAEDLKLLNPRKPDSEKKKMS